MKPSVIWPILKFSRTFNFKFAKICQSSGVVRYFSAENLDEKEIVMREKIQLRKPVVKKWKRPPFVKNMFLGIFDTELLAFPEILDKEQVQAIEEIAQDLQLFYKKKVNSFQIDEEKKIPKDVLQNLKEMGLFGRMVPERYGGLGLTYTECIRLNEVLGLDLSISATLIAHEFLATQAILLAGTEAQKAKYLPDLASGKRIAAVCCHEPCSGSDLSAIETTASLLPDDEKTYVISGTKSWVTNAELADLYIVFAKTLKKPSIKEEEVTVFIVDRTMDNMNIIPTDKTGLRGTNTGTVHFIDTPVSSENILGSSGNGFTIWLKMQESSNLLTGSATFGVLKSLLGQVTEHVIDTERMGKSLSSTDLVRERLAKVAIRIYAMESLSYYTAAIYDSTDNPDCNLESAIVKVFNSEGTLFCLRELMTALGTLSLFKTQHLERLYRDAQALAIFEGTNDIARIYIGLRGCQYVGSEKAQTILKMRNPFFFPMDRIYDMWRFYRVSKDSTTYSQDLAGFIHPSLVQHGNNLEACLQKFEIVVERVLSDNGLKIVDIQMDPRTLANIVIDLYAMSAVLTRCSRSYCTGLRHADHELRLTYTFGHNVNKRACQLFKDIMQGFYQNNDGNHLITGIEVVNWKGFYPEHPLKHNF